MTETGTSTVPWAERMQLLKDTAQQRVFNAPMPDQEMQTLLTEGKATTLGTFDGSPVTYLGRWWRHGEHGWLALEEEASAELDLHAERYRAATAATKQVLSPRTSALEPPQPDEATPARGAA